MTVNEYHDIHCLSASKLKLFTQSLWKFKKWWVDKIEPPEKKSTSITLGNLVDFRLLRDLEAGTGEEKFDDVFTLYTGKQVTGQVLELAEELYSVTMESVDDLGKVNRTIESLLDEAITNYAFDNQGEQIYFKQQKTREKIIDYFTKKGGFDYYQSLRQNTGKDVVTLKDLEIADKLVQNLKSHWTTRDIFLTRSSDRRDIINQFPFEFEILGMKVKILVDKVIVNHQKKKVFIFELKTCFDQYQFERNFIDLGYYFQLGMYTGGVVRWLIEKGYEYDIEPVKFVVCPTTFTQAPFQVHSTMDDYAKSMNGFTYHNRKIKGIKQCIEEIQWHDQKGIWDMEKELYENKGIKKINFMQ